MTYILFLQLAIALGFLFSVIFLAVRSGFAGTKAFKSILLVLGIVTAIQLIAGVWRGWLTVPGALSGLITALFILICWKLHRSFRSLVVSILLSAGAIVIVVIRPGVLNEMLFEIIEPEPMQVALLPARIVSNLPAPEPIFYESIVALANGDFYVTAASTGEILKVAPDGRVELFARLPAGHFDIRNFKGLPIGIDVGPDGAIFAVLNSQESEHTGVWRLPVDGGEPQLWVPLPPESQPNGLAISPQGQFYIADALLGAVWSASWVERKAQIWYQGDLIGSKIPIPLPTANGIKVSGNSVIVSNTIGRRIVRIPILHDGSAGTAEVLATGIPVDDFAVSKAGNIYATTHPFNTLVKITPQGDMIVVADHRQGVVGPTAAVFGRTLPDQTAVFVVCDGGFSKPLESGDYRPVIVRVEVGEE